MPGWDVPMATLVTEPVEGDIPMALPVAQPLARPVPAEAEPAPAALPPSPTDPDLLLEPIPAPGEILCPACTASNPPGQPYCSDCGYYFSAADLAAPASPSAPAAAPAPLTLLQGRYELGELLGDRLGVQRYRAIDRGDDDRPTLEVTVLRQKFPPPPAPSLAGAEARERRGRHPAELRRPRPEQLPGDRDPRRPAPLAEHRLGAEAAPHAGTPRPARRAATLRRRRARVPRRGGAHGPVALGRLGRPRRRRGAAVRLPGRAGRAAAQPAPVQRHGRGAAARTSSSSTDGRVRLTDLADLLPLPLPPDAPVRGGLVHRPGAARPATASADARADLYSFGAMLYALHVGRELNEQTDFDSPGHPKPFIPRFPDIHPRLRPADDEDVPQARSSARFPTDEAGSEDPTGFSELIRTLEVLRRTLRQRPPGDRLLDVDRHRPHRQRGRLRPAARRRVAPGRPRRGGAGPAVRRHGRLRGRRGRGGDDDPVAAASNCRQMPPFNVAAGRVAVPDRPADADGEPRTATPRRRSTWRQVKLRLKSALTRRQPLVFQTSRAPGSKRAAWAARRRPSTSTAATSSSATSATAGSYHLHEGRLIQLTRDQTLVNRLVELGTLTAEEAETHPRRNELQQAIGGQPDVEPGMYHGKMSPGDWVIVCSDGLTNHVKARTSSRCSRRRRCRPRWLRRRLVNLTLIEGATDNVTVVAIRAT